LYIVKHVLVEFFKSMIFTTVVCVLMSFMSIGRAVPINTLTQDPQTGVLTPWPYYYISIPLGLVGHSVANFVIMPFFFLYPTFVQLDIGRPEKAKKPQQAAGAVGKPAAGGVMHLKRQNSRGVKNAPPLPGVSASALALDAAPQRPGLGSEAAAFGEGRRSSQSGSMGALVARPRPQRAANSRPSSMVRNRPGSFHGQSNVDQSKESSSQDAILNPNAGDQSAADFAGENDGGQAFGSDPSGAKNKHDTIVEQVEEEEAEEEETMMLLKDIREAEKAERERFREYGLARNPTKQLRMGLSSMLVAALEKSRKPDSEGELSIAGSDMEKSQTSLANAAILNRIRASSSMSLFNRSSTSLADLMPVQPSFEPSVRNAVIKQRIQNTPGYFDLPVSPSKATSRGGELGSPQSQPGDHQNNPSSPEVKKAPSLSSMEHQHFGDQRQEKSRQENQAWGSPAQSNAHSDFTPPPQGDGTAPKAVSRQDSQTSVMRADGHTDPALLASARRSLGSELNVTNQETLMMVVKAALEGEERSVSKHYMVNMRERLKQNRSMFSMLRRSFREALPFGAQRRLFFRKVCIPAMIYQAVFIALPYGVDLITAEMGKSDPNIYTFLISIRWDVLRLNVTYVLSTILILVILPFYELKYVVPSWDCYAQMLGTYLGMERIQSFKEKTCRVLLKMINHPKDHKWRGTTLNMVLLWLVVLTVFLRINFFAIKLLFPTVNTSDLGLLFDGIFLAWVVFFAIVLLIGRIFYSRWELDFVSMRFECFLTGWTANDFAYRCSFFFFEIPLLWFPGSLEAGGHCTQRIFFDPRNDKHDLQKFCGCCGEQCVQGSLLDWIGVVSGCHPSSHGRIPRSPSMPSWTRA
jgi:hypothetical protein